MPITEILARNAALYGEEISLVEINPGIREIKASWKDYELVETNPEMKYRREITWREFDDKANRLANFLRERGLQRGHKVAILLMNCLEWLPIYFGILKTGAIAVPLNYRYTEEEIKYCLDLAECDILVFGPEFTERVAAIRGQIPKVKIRLFLGHGCPAFAESYYALTACCSSTAPKVTLSDDDDAVIYFSSGTTGFPKAVLHAHRSLMTSCAAEMNHHKQTREDNFLCIPPLYHTGAKMHWFGSLLSGSKAVLLRGVKPEWIIKTISEERITVLWLLVPWAQDILDAIDRGDITPEEYHLDQCRLMHIGAQPVPPSLINRWKKHFPHHDYDTNYGLSEAIGPGCVHLGIENSHKVGAIGKAGYQWELQIVDASGREVKQGEVGELCVKGPGVMKCYYNNPEASAEVLKDGWLYTGDMARMDEDGFVYLVDRKKDVIICGGENLYPVQIENFLHTYDAVKDVAVIGLPDQHLGEIPAAIIELKPGFSCSEAEMAQFCAGLPRYKRPRKIIFEEIPRNPTGKIEKQRLREKHFCGSLVEAQTENH
ncbi:AMP-binding protein [Oryzomonas japonica]|uniref:AMP-binding protein n=1 Tax=Oryzomonas japonica TaxID=2603858 RepID=A0A7J4ZNL7_9BACT|nr:AMP-binding protein [Oryzomonas japonica]KAB0664396.1 AMP-binding protein [Oryzomonas japonica]